MAAWRRSRSSGRPRPASFRRARVAVVLAALHEPGHVLRLDAPFELQDAARPQPDGLLIVANAEALALEVLRVILADAGRFADVDVGVGEGAVMEDGQHPVGEAERPHAQVGGHGHLGDVVAVELDLFVEHAGDSPGHSLIVERDAVRFHFLGNHGHNPVVGSDSEREVQVRHGE